MRNNNSNNIRDRRNFGQYLEPFPPSWEGEKGSRKKGRGSLKYMYVVTSLSLEPRSNHVPPCVWCLVSGDHGFCVSIGQMSVVYLAKTLPSQTCTCTDPGSRTDGLSLCEDFRPKLMQISKHAHTRSVTPRARWQSGWPIACGRQESRGQSTATAHTAVAVQQEKNVHYFRLELAKTICSAGVPSARQTVVGSKNVITEAVGRNDSLYPALFDSTESSAVERITHSSSVSKLSTPSPSPPAGTAYINTDTLPGK